MISKRARSTMWFLIVSGLSLFSGSANAEYEYSSTRNFKIYSDPWYNSAGQMIGVKIYYSVGLLQDTGRPAHYAAVCVKDGRAYSPCLDPASKVWTRWLSSSIGTWMIQQVPLDCSGAAAGRIRDVQVHQPYYFSNSDLNFPLSGGSPYQGTQLFYRGSSDTAKLQLIGCYQALR